MSDRKALLIGINYVGSKQELRGCHQDVRNVKAFLEAWGFREEDTVVLLDEPHVDPHGRHYPSGENILQAIDWLVRDNAGKSLFLHYSGHGSQVADPDGSGVDMTLVPADYERNGQINSDVLHQRVVWPLDDSAQMHVIFDCCHSGSGLELPYVYRTDDEGNVKLIDNLKAGIKLANDASRLLQGGFSNNSVREAQSLYAGATSFFKGLQRSMSDEGGEQGLDHAEGGSDYRGESKPCILFSGCKDEQTSADAHIGGEATGAMSWAFLQVMRENDGQQTYVDVLRNTRQRLKQNYEQIPQLSCGQHIDLDRPFRI